MDSKKNLPIDLNRLTVSPQLLKLLPYDLMRRHLVLPFDQQDGSLSIAIADPNAETVLNQIRMITGFSLDVFAADPKALAATVERLYNAGEAPPVYKELDFQGAENDFPTSKMVDKIIHIALRHRASDIHLEPQSDALFVRLRVDGALQSIHHFPKSVSVGIVSRIKVLAGMDITEKRLPQDGQIGMRLQGKEVDLRVSTLPGKHGEKVVIRLLDKSSGVVDLGALGMEPVAQGHFEMMVDQPQGLVLVTGPTGSGKTTTLYAVLNRLRSPLKNIITFEDPIEYELLASCANEAGVTQVQINPKIGLTFAAGLRASLRQDPDVVMVGEIRDKDTAEIAMKAAMTGHLVLSTLHTNDAPSAIVRLRDIGVDAYLIASTLTGVVAQRLVRLLCNDCKAPYQPPARSLKNLFSVEMLERPMTFYRPRGCPLCLGTGYWGRDGIFELLTITEELRELIHEGGHTDALKKLAQSQGLKTLRASGLELVCQGLTTIEEVFRHTVD